MAKFSWPEIKFCDEYKKFIVEHIKPLMQKNDMSSVRELIYECVHNGAYDEILGRGASNDPWEIQTFLLRKLGEQSYFRDSDSIFELEFFQTAVESLVLPSNIDTIYTDAFTESALKTLKITSDTIDICDNAFNDTDCVIYVPKKCKVYIFMDDGGYVVGCSEITAAPTKEKRWEIAKDYWLYDECEEDTQEELEEDFDKLEQNLLSKIKRY